MSMPISDSSSIDPYSTAGTVSQMDTLIVQILHGLQHHQDQTGNILMLCNSLQTVQGDLVGQSSKTEDALTGLTQGLSNLQAYATDKNGKPMQLVDPRTGAELTNPDGTPQMGSPDQCFANQATFIINSQYTPGSALYDYTQSNPTQAAAIVSAVKDLVSGLSDGTDFTATTSGTPPSLTISITGDTPNADGSYPTGCIQNMWTQATPGSTPGSATDSPNSGILNSFQTAMGSAGQSITASSSNFQAYQKVLMTDYQGSQSNLSNCLQDANKMMGSMLNNQITH